MFITGLSWVLLFLQTSPPNLELQVLFEEGSTVGGIKFDGFRIPTLTRLKNGA